MKVGRYRRARNRYSVCKLSVVARRYQRTERGCDFSARSRCHSTCRLKYTYIYIYIYICIYTSRFRMMPCHVVRWMTWDSALRNSTRLTMASCAGFSTHDRCRAGVNERPWHWLRLASAVWPAKRRIRRDSIRYGTVRYPHINETRYETNRVQMKRWDETW